MLVMWAAVEGYKNLGCRGVVCIGNIVGRGVVCAYTRALCSGNVVGGGFVCGGIRIACDDNVGL